MMKKDIFNDDEAFFKWIEDIQPEEIPEKLNRKYHKKLKRKIFRQRLFSINFQPKISKLALSLGAVLICIILIPITINAAIHGNLFGVFVNDNEFEAYADTTSNSGEIAVPNQTSDKSDIDNTDYSVNSSIVNENSFDTTTIYTSVDDVEVVDNTIPEAIIGQNSIAIFTQSNNKGWQLKAGETLNLSLSIDEYFASADGSGEHLIFGYVFNNKYYEVDFSTSIDFSFQLTATEDGIYYPAIQNVSLSYIKIPYGTIEIK